MASENNLPTVLPVRPPGYTSLSPTDNLRDYLSEAILPTMVHGSCAPPMPPDGHKSHFNHLAIQPEEYRSHFVKIVAPKDKKYFNSLVLEFTDRFPNTKIDEPTVDDNTGYAFTIPAKGFNIQLPSIPRPTNVREITPWVLTLPLQTMTRTLHVVFEEARNWDITHVNEDDRDAHIWTTLVWRKTPPPSNIETFYIKPKDPLAYCSVVFAIQPPWIVTPQDLKSFVRCSSLPPFNPWDEGSNRKLTSAERVWGKLWDTCVRLRCHHWVLSTYWGWVFGAFSQAFSAGQILAMKNHDDDSPSVLECLVSHVASSMGLVESSKLPQYFETAEQLEWDLDIPDPDRFGEIDFPDSGSEWDGMDEEPRISAAISTTYEGKVSNWGEDIDDERPRCRIPWPGTTGDRRPVQLHPTRANELIAWQEDVDELQEMEDVQDIEENLLQEERSASPSPSESAWSNASMYQAAQRAGSEIPEVHTVPHKKTYYGSTLYTVVEQGPAEEQAEGE